MIEDTADILERIRRGEMKVIEDIYLSNRRNFLRFARGFDLRTEEKIDVFQDAILALRHNVIENGLKDINGSVSTYLFSIGKFMMLKILKYNKRYVDLSLEDHQLLMDNAVDFETYEGGEQDLELVRLALERAGPKCSELINLFYLRGYTLQELQSHFGYGNYDVVKSQKSRCLKKIKALIQIIKNDQQGKSAG